MKTNLKQFIFIIHNCKKQSTKKEWDDFISILVKGKHLSGGSSLGKGIGIKNGENISPLAKTIGGYMIINAKSSAIAKKLAQLCPVHSKGGIIDIFPLVRDK